MREQIDTLLACNNDTKTKYVALLLKHRYFGTSLCHERLKGVDRALFDAFCNTHTIRLEHVAVNVVDRNCDNYNENDPEIFAGTLDDRYAKDSVTLFLGSQTHEAPTSLAHTTEKYLGNESVPTSETYHFVALVIGARKQQQEESTCSMQGGAQQSKQ